MGQASFGPLEKFWGLCSDILKEFHVLSPAELSKHKTQEKDVVKYEKGQKLEGVLLDFRYDNNSETYFAAVDTGKNIVLVPVAESMIDPSKKGSVMTVDETGKKSFAPGNEMQKSSLIDYERNKKAMIGRFHTVIAPSSPGAEYQATGRSFEM